MPTSMSCWLPAATRVASVMRTPGSAVCCSPAQAALAGVGPHHVAVREDVRATDLDDPGDLGMVERAADADGEFGFGGGRRAAAAGAIAIRSGGGEGTAAAGAAAGASAVAAAAAEINEYIKLKADTNFLDKAKKIFT